MPIQDFRELFRESTFGVFQDIVADGGTVRGVRRAECGRIFAQRGRQHRQSGEGGRAAIVPVGAPVEDGAITSSDHESGGRGGVRQMLDATGDRQGGLLFVAAGEPDTGSKMLGQLRLTMAKKDGLLNPEKFAFPGWWISRCWSGTRRKSARSAMHHPFTSPHDADLPKLDREPARRAPRRMIWC